LSCHVSLEELVMPPIIDAFECCKLAKATRKRADSLPPGPEKEQLLSEALNYEVGARSDNWRSSSLRAPE
jgi:hypothetical protein